MISSLAPRICVPGRAARLAAPVLLSCALRALPAAAAEADRYWPQWRGPLGTGEAPQARPPLAWGEGRNVQFKVAIPGAGKGTPVVWKDLVVLTTAVPASGGSFAFTVLALDRADGRVRWRRVVREEAPHEGTHQDGTFASASASTDGERVYAYFGSRGLYALDLADGRLVWKKDLGRMRTRMSFGEGSSPALHAGILVVNWDHEDADFLAAFDARTGRELWRREREESTSWSTPHVVVHPGRAQVVVGATGAVRGYDLATGQELWAAPGLTANAIPTPVSGEGMVYAMSGFRGSALRAVRVAEARGAVTGPPALAWTYDRDTPYVPSPLLYRGALYFLKSNSGVLSSLEARTGAPRFTARLEAVPNVYASPVAADGRIYVAGREGTVVVLEAGPALKVLATNVLDDAFDASPVLVEGDLYLRGRQHLYRIAEH